MTQLIKTVDEFNEMIASETPIVMKFTADWCPDCKRLDMFIHEVFEQLSEVPFFEIDKDKFPDLTEKYSVMGIPSLLIFKNNEKIAHLHSANAKTPEEVTEFLSPYFAK
ncbi:thioredoxin family protein [Bacillus solimangrovi]|uniref:Thiol reductase thioredoxin n=1 Tax=Bacillus solimangrovi TaxID=1305675 RepID=A0A1E5LGA6_9BACI|nr:thioredoxin family protein [Bacillus solimangrovi]OEH93110.1 thiol reductase thioredoxin [Bacillus solimangrovi]